MIALEQFKFVASQPTPDQFGVAYLQVMDGLAFGFHELGGPMTLVTACPSHASFARFHAAGLVYPAVVSRFADLKGLQHSIASASQSFFTICSGPCSSGTRISILGQDVQIFPASREGPPRFSGARTGTHRF